jgi:hypothetical protein
MLGGQYHSITSVAHNALPRLTRAFTQALPRQQPVGQNARWPPSGVFVCQILNAEIV